MSFTDDERAAWSHLNKMNENVTATEQELKAWQAYNTGEVPTTGIEPVKLSNQVKDTRKGKFRITEAFRVELLQKLQQLYPSGVPGIPQFFRKYRRAEVCKTVFGSDLWNQGKEKHILVRWD